MSRYILIDRYSGFIFGDTGDLNGPARNESPLEAAKRLDEHIGGPDYVQARIYQEHGPREAIPDGCGAYFVYCAVGKGSELVMLVQDGQDQETIDEVERLCDLVAIVTKHEKSPYSD